MSKHLKRAGLWGYVSRSWAEKGWKRWLSWAVTSRLAPVKEVAKTIKEHLWGIPNAVVLKVDNGHAESTNSRIKTIKMRSRGFRNKERFRNAIYFHLGGLDFYPAGIHRWNLPTRSGEDPKNYISSRFAVTCRHLQDDKIDLQMELVRNDRGDGFPAYTGQFEGAKL